MIGNDIGPRGTLLVVFAISQFLYSNNKYKTQQNQNNSKSELAQQEMHSHNELYSQNFHKLESGLTAIYRLAQQKCCHRRLRIVKFDSHTKATFSYITNICSYKYSAYWPLLLHDTPLFQRIGLSYSFSAMTLIKWRVCWSLHYSVGKAYDSA